MTSPLRDPDSPRSSTGALVPVLALALLATAPALAKEPLTLTLRPSSVDTLSAEARAREERLQRRLREADFLFRHICVHCGGGDRSGPHAPFDPVGALHAPPR